MIEKMARNELNIFDVELSEDKSTLVINEACDGYYYAYLKKHDRVKSMLTGLIVRIIVK